MLHRNEGRVGSGPQAGGRDRPPAPWAVRARWGDGLWMGVWMLIFWGGLVALIASAIRGGRSGRTGDGYGAPGALEILEGALRQRRDLRRGVPGKEADPCSADAVGAEASRNSRGSRDPQVPTACAVKALLPRCARFGHLTVRWRRPSTSGPMVPYRTGPSTL